MDAYIMNRGNWKKTGKKSYEIWVCMPPIGTVVKNHLEGIKYKVDPKQRFVLCGTQGEMWVIDGNKLASTYTFATGEPINPESIGRKTKDGVMEWAKVKTRPGMMNNFALLLPKGKYTNFPVSTAWGSTLVANRPEVKHGRGDYLVCSMAQDGGPNLADVWVVNGPVFYATYNLQNIQVTENEKMLSAQNLPMPASICEVKDPRMGTFKRSAAQIMKNVGVSDSRIQEAMQHIHVRNELGYQLWTAIGKIRTLRNDQNLVVEVDAQFDEKTNSVDFVYSIQADDRNNELREDVLVRDGAGCEISEFSETAARVVNMTNKFREITTVGEMTLAKIMMFRLRESLKGAARRAGVSFEKWFPISWDSKDQNWDLEYSNDNKAIPLWVRYDFDGGANGRVRPGFIYVTLRPGDFTTVDISVCTYDPGSFEGDPYQRDWNGTSWDNVGSSDLAEIMFEEIFE